MFQKTDNDNAESSKPRLTMAQPKADTKETKLLILAGKLKCTKVLRTSNIVPISV